MNPAGHCERKGRKENVSEVNESCDRLKIGNNLSKDGSKELTVSAGMLVACWHNDGWFCCSFTQIVTLKDTQGHWEGGQNNKSTCQHEAIQFSSTPNSQRDL